MFVKVMINRICSLEGGYCFTIAFTAKKMKQKKGLTLIQYLNMLKNPLKCHELD